MQDPMEPDRQEILTGPGDMPRPARKARSTDNKKTVVIAASALVAVLAAGGIGFALAGGPAQPTTPAGQAGQSSQAATADELQQDEEASMGDAKTDAPDAGTPSDVADEPLTDTGATDTGNTDNTGKADKGLDKGSAGTDSRTTPPTQNGKKPTSAPTKPAQESAGESPADGPAGQVIGQCSKSGC
ncbi:hypothetical protein [Nonomuraea sp. NPDC048901]|uniref:hypothetical protein n=1 Tax=Nonomuraea sp. NPDC048901 TaxID=3155627 RepID=UPI003404D46A